MSKSIKAFILVALLINACSNPSALDQAGTMVAQTVAAAPPSETPLPAATSLPTSSPTALPTSTPDSVATSTVVASSVLSEISGVLDEGEVPYKAGSLLWQQFEEVTIGMTGPQAEGNIRELDEDINAENFIFKSDVTWNANGLLICGAVFRAEPNSTRGDHYEFYFYRLSGLPAYIIDAYSNNQVKYTVSDMRFSSELDVGNNKVNQFILVAIENQFIVYVNGVRQGRFFDNSRHRFEGAFGFLGWQDSGAGSCSFENSWIWALPDE